jgi:hypothetical protein
MIMLLLARFAFWLSDVAVFVRACVRRVRGEGGDYKLSIEGSSDGCALWWSVSQ